jgi:hypothetical protein
MACRQAFCFSIAHCSKHQSQSSEGSGESSAEKLEIETRAPPGLLAATLAALPSMSLGPLAPFISFCAETAPKGFASGLHATASLGIA